jgi:hypothetical protein
MQELASLSFTPDGTGHCLYHELISLQSIGKIECSRASNIEFNPQTQEWEVRLPGESDPRFCSLSRQECLDWERANLECVSSTRKEAPNASPDHRTESLLS